MILKEYIGTPLKEMDPMSIAADVGTVGIVLIRDSGATAKEFADWSWGLGYHLSPDIWCTDKEFGGVFSRVTNQIIDSENQGMAGDHALDWHSNITPVLDSEELVGLYGRTFTYPTETWFCNSIPYWQQLNPETKERYRKLTAVLDPNRRLGRIQPGWSLNFKEIYSNRIIDDLVKNRRTRQIKNATNIEPHNRDKFKDSRGIIENTRFVPNHPLGTEGLFFSPNEIHGFYENGQRCEDSEEIYWKVWEELVVSESFTYKHHWNPGDIILMDQILTIHKRPQIRNDMPRELLRLAAWYKSDLRRHFDYVF